MTAPSKDWVSPKIEIREITGKGRGMFGDEKIAQVQPENKRIEAIRNGS